MEDEKKEYKIVNASVYDPADSIFKSSRNDRSECKILMCNNSENCQLFARKECAQLAVMSSTSCPYGKRNFEQGPTRRAATYSKWIRERKERHKDVLRKLGSYNAKLAVVGDYIFLPYPHMNMGEHLPFLSKGGFMSSGSNFIPKESFTPEVVVKLIQYTPQAMMGGTITSYQKDVVPKFIKHLQESMPDMFDDVAKIYPEINERLAEYTFVGREAYLHSLKPGTIVHKYHDTPKLATQDWLWDGEYLTSTNTSISFSIVSYDEIEIKIKPQTDVTVEITSDEQVDVNTKFKT